MGLFSKQKTSATISTTSSTTASEPTSSSGTTATTRRPAKKSFFQKYQDLKRGPGTANLSDDEFEKATGMTREQMAKYTATALGVGGGQAAGSITAGGTSGFGLAGTAGGLGGWGPEAGKQPKER